MLINGVWYTETEVMCYIEKLQNKIAELEKQLKEDDCNEES